MSGAEETLLAKHKAALLARCVVTEELKRKILDHQVPDGVCGAGAEAYQLSASCQDSFGLLFLDGQLHWQQNEQLLERLDAIEVRIGEVAAAVSARASRHPPAPGHGVVGFWARVAGVVAAIAGAVKPVAWPLSLFLSCCVLSPHFPVIAEAARVVVKAVVELVA